MVSSLQNKKKTFITLARSPDLIPCNSNSQMAGLLSRNLPAHLTTGLDGAAVAAGTVEVRDAQACPHQSTKFYKEVAHPANRTYTDPSRGGWRSCNYKVAITENRIFRSLKWRVFSDCNFVVAKPPYQRQAITRRW